MPQGYSKSIHALVLILSVFGAVMATSAGMHQTTSVPQITIAFAKHIAFIVLGLILMIKIAQFASLSLIRRYIFPLSILMVLGLLATLFFPARGGAQAWIDIPFLPITIAVPVSWQEGSAPSTATAAFCNKL